MIGAIPLSACMLSITFPVLQLLDEFFEEPKRKLLADEVCHQERAPLRLGHALSFPWPVAL